MNFLNYLIIRSLVKVKFANIINIAAGKEVIPEFLQIKCNSKDLFKSVSSFIDDPNKIKEQVDKDTINPKLFKTDISSIKLASKALVNFYRLLTPYLYNETHFFLEEDLTQLSINFAVSKPSYAVGK